MAKIPIQFEAIFNNIWWGAEWELGLGKDGRTDVLQIESPIYMYLADNNPPYKGHCPKKQNKWVFENFENYYFVYCLSWIKKKK